MKPPQNIARWWPVKDFRTKPTFQSYKLSIKNLWGSCPLDLQVWLLAVPSFSRRKLTFFAMARFQERQSLWPESSGSGPSLPAAQRSPSQPGSKCQARPKRSATDIHLQSPCGDAIYLESICCGWKAFPIRVWSLVSVRMPGVWKLVSWILMVASCSFHEAILSGWTKSGWAVSC